MMHSRPYDGGAMIMGGAHGRGAIICARKMTRMDGGDARKWGDGTIAWIVGIAARGGVCSLGKRLA